jgi:predicted RNase H-like HicB family nuclease
MTRSFTAVLHQEGPWYVAHCPELDVVSQGETLEAAKANLREAVEAVLELASPEELQERLTGDIYITPLEVSVA